MSTGGHLVHICVISNLVIREWEPWVGFILSRSCQAEFSQLTEAISIYTDDLNKHWVMGRPRQSVVEHVGSLLISVRCDPNVALHLPRIVYKLAVMVYKCLHGLAPPYLAADCVPVTSVASRRHLRSAVSGCLAVTGTRTTLGRRNFAVTGATIWNNIPADLRLHSQSLLSFGQKLKQYLFEPWAHLRNFV